MVWTKGDTLNNTFFSQDFLIDTGCSETFIFTTDKQASIFGVYKFYNVTEEPKEKWVTVGDCKQVRTFSATISIQINGVSENIPIFIIEGERNDIPVVGMKFFEKKKKRLLIDYSQNVFELT